jgi:hypothetical protein
VTGAAGIAALLAGGRLDAAGSSSAGAAGRKRARPGHLDDDRASISSGSSRSSDDSLRMIVVNEHNGNKRQVSARVARELDSEHLRKLRGARQLSLVLDLDHTLLHVTRDTQAIEAALEAVAAGALQPDDLVVFEMEEFWSPGAERRAQEALALNRQRSQEWAKLAEAAERRAERRAEDAEDGIAAAEANEDSAAANGAPASTGPLPPRLVPVPVRDPATGLCRIRYGMKLRPGLRAFLATLSERFVLQIDTAAVRSYALIFCRAVDPTGALFGDRIVARTDFAEGGRRKLSAGWAHRALADDSMVLILDDTHLIWKNPDTGAEAANLLQIKPYVFWSPEEEVNNQAGADATATAASAASEGRGAGVRSKSHFSEEVHPYLRDMKALLHHLHGLYFEQWDAYEAQSAAIRDGAASSSTDGHQLQQQRIPLPRTQLLVPACLGQLLRDTCLAFTGVFRLDERPELQPLWIRAQQFGAAMAEGVLSDCPIRDTLRLPPLQREALEKAIRRLVREQQPPYGSEDASATLQEAQMFVVQSELEEVVSAEALAAIHHIFLAPTAVTRYPRPLWACLQSTFSASVDTISADSSASGVPAPDAAPVSCVTHLVSARIGTDKMLSAHTDGGIHVVSVQWLAESLRRFRRQSESEFPFPAPSPSTPGAAAAETASSESPRQTGKHERNLAVFRKARRAEAFYEFALLYTRIASERLEHLEEKWRRKRGIAPAAAAAATTDHQSEKGDMSGVQQGVRFPVDGEEAEEADAGSVSSSLSSGTERQMQADFYQTFLEYDENKADDE